jgi:hypothetical protein
MIYDSTISVLITAIWSLSLSVAPDFSPIALDQSLQSFAAATFTVFYNFHWPIQFYKYAQVVQCAHMLAKDCHQLPQHRVL